MFSISSRISTFGRRGCGSGFWFRALTHACMPSVCGMLVYNDDTTMLARILFVGILVDQINSWVSLTIGVIPIGFFLRKYRCDVLYSSGGVQ